MKNDKIPAAIIQTISSLGILVMVFILFFLIKEGLPVLSETTLGDLLTGKYWYPTEEPPVFGMLPLLLGSLSVTLASSLLAVPVSLLVAIFVAEVAPDWMHDLMKPVLELLGFLPSIILGFLGMVLIAPKLQETFMLITGLNMFNASILLGIMIIPIVSSLAEEALTSVPRELRDASYALGATRWETIVKVVVPYALPGIQSGALLGIMRGMGETMVVLMAAGGAAILPRSIFDPVRPLTSTIAAEMGETPVGSPHYHALFFAGLLLLVITLIINLISIWVEKRGRLERS
ncbi:MAG: phosphate ABC transporter permease subunit PstC [Synergistales bacterium]|nr:phosphate ABC transporter permease subunit PstC [Synergistales bacterium]